MSDCPVSPGDEAEIREALADYRVREGLGIWKLPTPRADAALAAFDRLVAERDAWEKIAATTKDERDAAEASVASLRAALEEIAGLPATQAAAIDKARLGYAKKLAREALVRVGGA